MRAMQKILESGLNLFQRKRHNYSSSYHFSNFQGGVLLDLVRYARIPPAVLQVELHPLLAQKSLVRLAHALGIVVTAYSSFGPSSYVELEMHKNLGPLLEHSSIVDIAKAKAKCISFFKLKCNNY